MPETPAIEPTASEPQPRLLASSMAVGISTATTDDSTARRWPAIMALLVGWLMPRTTARRLVHVGLLGAFAVQVASGICGFLAFVVYLSWMKNDPLLRVFTEMAHEISRQPEQFMMGLAIGVAITEASLFGLAMIFLPWGARDEKLRSSLYNAVRCIWLQTPQIANSLFVLLVTFVMLKGHYTLLGRPRDGELWTYLAMLLGIWCIWGILRAMGARPVRRRDDAAVICQSCGYNLFGTPLDGRCSECGEPAANSITADSRPGSLWQRRTGASTLMTWWRCSVQSIRNPRRLGRQLQVYWPEDDSWKLLVGHAVLSGLMAVIGTLGWFWIWYRYRMFSVPLYNPLWFSMLVAAFWTGMAVVTVASIAAGFCGLWFGLSQGCRVMPAAVRVVCHLAGFLTLWVCYCIVAMFVCMLTKDVHWSFYVGRQPIPVFVFIYGGVLNVVWLLIYGRLIYLVVSQTRYATR